MEAFADLIVVRLDMHQLRDTPVASIEGQGSHRTAIRAGGEPRSRGQIKEFEFRVAGNCVKGLPHAQVDSHRRGGRLGQANSDHVLLAQRVAIATLDHRSDGLSVAHNVRRVDGRVVAGDGFGLVDVQSRQIIILDFDFDAGNRQSVVPFNTVDALSGHRIDGPGAVDDQRPSRIARQIAKNQPLLARAWAADDL